MTGTQVIAGAGTSVPLKPLVVRISQAGVLLGGISKRTVYRLIEAGELEVVPVGHTRMVVVASIEAYVKRQAGNVAQLEACVNRTQEARQRRIAAAAAA